MPRNADVVLSPLGRRARYGSAPIVAIVSQGFQDRGSDYTHPTVELRPVDSEGGYGLKAFCVRFQQHRKTPDIMYWRPGRGGFLATRGQWSAAYAPTIECSMDNRKWIRRCLDIVGGAEVRTMGDRRIKKGGDCDLLRLIVGLQRSGVEVHIFSEHVRTLRAKRAKRAPMPAASDLDTLRVVDATTCYRNGRYGFRIEEGPEEGTVFYATEEDPRQQPGSRVTVRYYPQSEFARVA